MGFEMNSCLAILLVFCFSHRIKADNSVPECPGIIQFDPPKNISVPIWYPTNSSQWMTFPANYNCTYQINVPQGWSAYISLTAEPETNQTDSPIIQVIDFNQRVENFVSATYEPFYFIAPGGKIKLSTQTTTVVFRFTVQWYSNITSSDYGFANVTVADTQPFVTDFFSKIIQVTAETRTTILVMPPEDLNFYGPYLKFLRRIVFFDGPNENSTCLGTAYQLLNSNRQYVSTGRVVTVIPLYPIYHIPDAYLMFQDFENTKEIGEYRTLACIGECAPMVMDGTKSASAFSTYFPRGISGDCLLGISGTGLLSVYYGGKSESKSNLIASYYLSNDSPVFPQSIRGETRTYVVTGGVATVNISQHSYSDCQYVETNREGFITSPNYHTGLDMPQSFDDIIYTSNGLYNFTLRVQDVDLSQNKSIRLSITNNRTRTLNVIYNSTNLPNSNDIVSGVGNEMRVIYVTELFEHTTGYYISYTAKKVKSLTSSRSLYFLVFVVLSRVF